jgi:predicted lipid-binding transport protein (Tim44 family)
MANDLIIYAIVAAALVFWLKNILGTKNGEERDHENPFAPKNDNRPGVPPSKTSENASLNPKTATGENTGFALPGSLFGGSGTDPLRITRATLSSRARIESQIATDGLRAIAARDPQFTLEKFLTGAEAAFDMIVTSFARSDRAILKTLLAPSVYHDFDVALTDRAARGETVETRIEAIRGMDVTTAKIVGNIAQISVRFTAQETCLVRNTAGALIAGDPDTATTMIDLWVFGRDITSHNPAWMVIETRDDMAEAHKTPMPESLL